MGRYLLSRITISIPTALFASILVFVLLRVLPGDVTLTILSGSPATTEMREALRRELELDDPLPLQYLKWLWRMANGDLGGRSLETREPIRAIVARQLPVTMLIALYTTALSITLSVPLGVLSATRRGTAPDLAVRLVSLGGVALPAVWLALIVLLFLLRLFRWSPPIIYVGLFDNPLEHAALLALPVLLLSWEYGSHILRTVRATMIDSLASPFVVSARARGVPQRRLVWRHAARPALVGAVTVAGLQFGTLIGGTLVVETIFGIPGIGRGLVDAALARDYPIVQTLCFLVVLFYLAVNLVVDLFYSVADPRIRLAGRPRS